ncbi:hypothetical protein C923_04468 [Plasmodium falciparum UGT5.1]|uniref:Uncharacterized protein n=2 Tax=Plasmodium falciparum TaxID=5833 RepID=W7JTE7_PLAFA|nr:hypothetical protein PFNF135_04550 [Plasmodium falciparum NF135/5.C10]EWC74856.1 hypothetical protein C923_04468 [Plasmodium falciparum UGT5.1]
MFLYNSDGIKYNLYIFLFFIDEALLRNLLKNNPDINPEYNITDIEGGMDNLSIDLSLVFSKHGVKDLDNNFVKDIIKVFELNGYRKMLDN